MPYLPVDMDGKRKATLVDQSLSLPRGTIIGGLLDVWEHVWRARKCADPDLVSPMVLTACFGPDKRIVPALLEAGFLEPRDDGRYRVRGAMKWLLGHQARSKGGHAAKGNLIPGAYHHLRVLPPLDPAVRSAGGGQPNVQPNAASQHSGTSADLSSASADEQPMSSPRPPSAPSSIQHLASDQEDLPAPDRAGQRGAQEQGELLAFPTLPKKERELPVQQRAKAYFDLHRAKKTEVSDETFQPAAVNAMLKEPILEFGRLEFSKMIDAYLADPRHAEKSWPFRLFVKIHRSYHKAAPQKNGQFVDLTHADPKDFQ